MIKLRCILLLIIHLNCIADENIIKDTRLKKIGSEQVGKIILKKDREIFPDANNEYPLKGCLEIEYYKKPKISYYIQVKKSDSDKNNTFLLEAGVKVTLREILFSPTSNAFNIIKKNYKDTKDFNDKKIPYYTSKELQGALSTFGWGFYTNGKKPPSLDISFEYDLDKGKRFKNTLRALIKSFNSQGFLAQNASFNLFNQEPFLLEPENYNLETIPKIDDYKLISSEQMEQSRESFSINLKKFLDRFCAEYLIELSLYNQELYSTTEYHLKEVIF